MTEDELTRIAEESERALWLLDSEKVLLAEAVERCCANAEVCF